MQVGILSTAELRFGTLFLGRFFLSKTKAPLARRGTAGGRPAV